MYIPSGLSVAAAEELRKSNPNKYKAIAMESMAKHVQAMLAFQRAGAEVFDYGNNIRQQAYNYGVTDAFEFPGFVPAYIRPLFCEGKGPFRWVALSGDKEDIYTTDQAITYATWNSRPTGRGRAPPRTVSANASPSGLGSGEIPNRSAGTMTAESRSAVAIPMPMALRSSTGVSL